MKAGVSIQVPGAPCGMEGWGSAQEEKKLTRGLRCRLGVRNWLSWYHHEPAQNTKDSENFNLKCGLPGCDEGTVIRGKGVEHISFGTLEA